MEDTDITATSPEPLIVLHGDRTDPVNTDPLDTEGVEEQTIVEQGFECLPSRLQALITDSTESPDWKRFINEATHLATIRAKSIPQTVTELVQCLIEWREFVDESPCLPPMNVTERPSVQNLLSFLQQEALKDVHERLERLTDDVKVLTSLNI